MRVGSAMDGQNYWCIRSDDGLWLAIVDIAHHNDGSAGVQDVKTSWIDDSRRASQWYEGHPPRVHLYDPDGAFRSAWCVGQDIAELLMLREGGHLVLIDGILDVPIEKEPFVPRDKRPTAWARVLRT